jgi:cytochrome b
METMVMWKIVTLSGVALTAMTQPAAALYIDHNDGTYSYVPDGAIFVAIVFLVIGFAVVAGFFSTAMSSPSAPPREKTADEYNTDAVLLAAKRHHTEMMTELRKAEIEAARIEAIHKERAEIIAHDKKVRDLSARLDEKRRAS